VTPTFEAYLASLTGLSVHADPTLATTHSEEIRKAAASLAAVPEITATALADWARRHPTWVPVLGLAAGLSQERLRNAPGAPHSRASNQDTSLPCRSPAVHPNLPEATVEWMAAHLATIACEGTTA
jgi:hypothetical protein